MSHFAKLDENSNVIGVHVVNNEVITINGVESEQVGIDFLIELHNHLFWKQTSYNGSFRKNYAAVGMKYDETRDAFMYAKPFDSWTLNETTCQWEPPVAYPDDEENYSWDEKTTSWVPWVQRS
jgi:hypothetical protein